MSGLFEKEWGIRRDWICLSFGTRLIDSQKLSSAVWSGVCAYLRSVWLCTTCKMAIHLSGSWLRALGVVYHFVVCRKKCMRFIAPFCCGRRSRAWGYWLIVLCLSVCSLTLCHKVFVSSLIIIQHKSLWNNFGYFNKKLCQFTELYNKKCHVQTATFWKHCMFIWKCRKQCS